MPNVAIVSFANDTVVPVFTFVTNERRMGGFSHSIAVFESFLEWTAQSDLPSEAWEIEIGHTIDTMCTGPLEIVN